MDERITHMEWSEVNDSTGEFEFVMDWTDVSSQYTPEEVQELINNSGVRRMVRVVNEHFNFVYNRFALLITQQDGRKLVTQR